MLLKNKYLVVINPVSGTKKNIPDLLGRILTKHNIHFDLFISKYKNHIKDYVHSLSSNLYTNIIIWGGDGTFNEVINGLLIRNDDYLPTLGLLPGGSGNSVMHDLEAITLEKAIKLIINNKKKMIDVMKIEYSNTIEYSINIVGWGMVADIAYLAEKLRWLGTARYTFASLIYILVSKDRQAILTIDNKINQNNYLFITISNTIFTGKGMSIAPKAKLDDGLLDINIVKNKISKFQLVKLLTKLFTGKHIYSPYVEYLQGENIQLDFNEIQKINIDGEIKNGNHIKVSILKKKLSIYY